MLTLLCVPISAVWLFARPLLLALSQEVAVAHMTAAYIRLLIPGLFASGVNYSITFYLQSQGIMRPGRHRHTFCIWLLPCCQRSILTVSCWQEP